ncbi:MAG TPA: dethiobiotin synthase [Thermoleophilaceae bacterium]|nr:dethiobiotin synthase [Thermoleophilaceae bacterium]
MRGIFVTGTDTGVGKSVLAAAICAALARQGARVAAFKPVVTGTDDPPGEWPPDHELLAAQTGQQPAEVTPRTFGPGVSPHLAAEMGGERVYPEEFAAGARRAAEGADMLVCEGVGGLMVPLARNYLVRDLAVELGLPLVVVARPGLGTISHTLLTVSAARNAGLPVAGVVITPWPAEADALCVSNRETIERLSGVTVSALPPTEPGTLAEAGAGLPLDDWI